MATIDIGKLTFTHKGDYAGGTAYVANDVVYYNGSAYIAKTSTTGNLPTSTAHWNTFATGSGGIWNAGLSLGSAGQTVKVNSSGNALEFGSGGGLLQTVFFQTSTRSMSSSDSYVATPMTITITPTSASSKIVLLLRTLINTTGDTYPRFKYQRAISGGATSFINTEPAGANGGNSLGVYLTDRANSTNNHQMNVMSDVYQDSPNTTSAITYTLYGVRENGGTYYINTSANNEGGGTSDYDQVGTSTLLAMETGV